MSFIYKLQEVLNPDYYILTKSINANKENKIVNIPILKDFKPITDQKEADKINQILKENGLEAVCIKKENKKVYGLVPKDTLRKEIETKIKEVKQIQEKILLFQAYLT